MTLIQEFLHAGFVLAMQHSHKVMTEKQEAPKRPIELVKLSEVRAKKMRRGLKVVS